jgi:hypothetical protein
MWRWLQASCPFWSIAVVSRKVFVVALGVLLLLQLLLLLLLLLLVVEAALTAHELQQLLLFERVSVAAH